MRKGTKEVKEIGEGGEIVQVAALEVSHTACWRSTGARVLSWGGLNGHRADASPCEMGYGPPPSSFPTTTTGPQEVRREGEEVRDEMQAALEHTAANLTVLPAASSPGLPHCRGPHCRRMPRLRVDFWLPHSYLNTESPVPTSPLNEVSITERLSRQERKRQRPKELQAGHW